MDSAANNKRIAKNTLFMYFRMAITMVVQLYTSRIILENLGVTDYGIYSIVGSFIVMFTFISGPLEAATQRFMTFELGRGNEKSLNTVFNISLLSHVVLALCLALIIEIAGVWYINNKMQMPVERIPAALGTYSLKATADGKLPKETSVSVVENGKGQNVVWNVMLASEESVTNIDVNSTTGGEGNVTTEALQGN